MNEISNFLVSIGLAEQHFPLLALPVIGAVIGWLTNYIAVKMLFHPKKPIWLVICTLHGVFPKRQAALAKKLGSVVSKELFSVAEVTSHIQEKAASDEVLALVSDKIELIIREKLPLAVPMVAMVLNDELIETVKATFVTELKEFVTGVTDVLTSSLERDLDVHKIVEEKVLGFSSDKLEELLFEIMRREFRFIELIGAVLGFAIGLGQVWYLLAVGG